MCGRWTGSCFMAVDCGDGARPEENGALGVYDSSTYGERVFCRQCGSSLPWRMRDGSQAYVAACAFDDPSVFSLTDEIVVDEKPDNHAFANRTRKLTGAEVWRTCPALHAPEDVRR